MLFALALSSGCARIAGLDDPLPNDGIISGPACYGQGLIKVCFTQSPTAMLPLGATINSGDSFCNQSVDMAMSVGIDANTCVISGTTITLATGTTTVASNATGTTPKPLVLVGTDSITIDGTLDATGARATTSTAPPGTPYAGCQNGNNPQGVTAGGGGQGGGFAGAGGNGGTGDGGAASGGTAGGALTAPTTLHAGCNGHAGASSGTDPGRGGGAIYLIAGNTLSVTGRIDASGGGGSTSNNNFLPDASAGSGGGGGGSGGMIGLDGATVSITGAVCAVGGGGAAGWGTTGGGSAGGASTGGNMSCMPGKTGTGSGGGGSGGAGAMMGNGMPGAAGAAGSGGGGGGGGAGYVTIYGAKSGVTTTNVVPPPM